MALEPGSLVLGGKYRIERLAGAGTFGEVYQATHLDLKAARAIKILRSDTSGLGSTQFDEYRGRFRLEAEIGARLEDPHVVRVYDYQEDQGALCLVMGWCAGGSLKDRLDQSRADRQPLPVAEAVRIAREVAQGLAAIHALGVVHRDLKPSNILFDADGHALVSDLGLAQVPGSSTRGSLLDDVPEHPGTPEYMSPEQENTKARLRVPSDVYALGAILFEMLTGQIYNNVRPGTRARALRAETPQWLDDLIAAMVAKTAEERPWDGAEVVRLLQLPVVDKEPPQLRRPRPWIAAGAAGLVVVALIVIFALVQSSPQASPMMPTQQVAAVTAQPMATQAPAAAPQALATAAPAPLQAAAPAEATTALAPEPTRAGTSPIDGMEQVYVPAGEFLMGSTDADAAANSNEKPQHRVTLAAYWIDRTEVTNDQYERCVAAGKCPNLLTATTPGDYPVVGVTWQNAADYCAWAGRRLPTEAEWEKAARGTDGRTYPWGNQAPAGNLLNFCDANCTYDYKDTAADDGFAQASPVGHYPAGASPYDARDMAGNVWEWTADWYGASYYASSPTSNPVGPSTGTQRTLRGGAWGLPPAQVRAAQRVMLEPGSTDGFIGFRCARTG